MEWFESPGTMATSGSIRRNIYGDTVPAHCVKDTEPKAALFLYRTRKSKKFGLWATMP